MRALSSLSIGLTLISGFLLLALVAEVYYLLWWKKKRTPSREIAGNDCKNREETLDPPADDQDNDLLMLFGPPRSLFTIKEETNDDLESESRKSSKRRSLSAQILTPLSSPPLFSTPPLSPSDRGRPLFGPRTASPPPKFRFLRDAEEKLHRRTMREEAMREEEDGSFITILVGKNNSSSSQVNPLPSPSADKSSGRGKLISYLSSSES
ncbi:uncharacterized protein LOC109820497 [Asparagus officinalis]|uniref:uncharacterized protein LOC109820497 n=1 Tax=Asparagus officinalis TaxID=4686 RepID=UPI00098E189C|nr:uncharacterized protein LOC109820497 [Asparagus officinalis]